MILGNGISMNFFIDTDTEIGRDFCWNCDFRKGRFGMIWMRTSQIPVLFSGVENACFLGVYKYSV